MNINDMVDNFRDTFEMKGRGNRRTQRGSQRIDDMLSLRFDNRWTLQEIADKYNISRERVRQLIGNSGSMYKSSRMAKEIVTNPELTNKELSQKLGITEHAVSRYRGHQRHRVETKGADVEIAVSKELERRGIKNKLMPFHHPFDILLENGKRVDVKSATKTIHPKSQSAPYYSFNIDKKRRGKYADFFILVCNLGMFVVPSDLMPAKAEMVRIQAVGKQRSKYAECKDRFDFLQ